MILFLLNITNVLLSSLQHATAIVGTGISEHVEEQGCLYKNIKQGL